MKIKLVLLLFLTLFIIDLKASDFTNFSINGGAGISYNMYMSDFLQLPGYPACCESYSFAGGIAPYFYAGMDWKKNFLGLNNSKFGLNLSYNNFSANYLNEQVIGNNLEENSYQKIYVEDKLDVSWSVIAVEPFISFEPVSDIPFELSFGAVLGFSISNSFEQQEKILSPNDIIFKNGSDIFYKYDGKLPNSNSIFLGLKAGTKYHVYNNNGLTISPELSVNYGLLSPVSGLSWNNIAIKGGISISYNFPEAAPERNVPPPMPKLIEPPKPPVFEKPVIDFAVFEQNKKLNNGDTLTAEFKIVNYNYYLSYIPVLFFEKDKTEPLNSYQINEGESIDNNFFELIRKGNFSENYPEIIKKYIDENDLTVEIIAENFDEELSVVDQRLSKIENILISSGISKDKIKAAKTRIKPKDISRDKLVEEFRRIRFKFSNSKDIITTTVIKDKIDNRFNRALAIIPEVKADAVPFSFNAYTQFNNGNQTTIDNRRNDILLSASLFESKVNEVNNFKITGEVTDSQTQTASKEFNLYLNSKTVIENNFFNISDNENTSTFILGFFNFDSFNFYSVDKNVLNYLTDKINNPAYSIELMPLTDNLGTPEYNLSLSQKRYDAAIKVLKSSKNSTLSNVKMVIPDKPVFNNETPYGRFLNRSVLINLRKK